MVSATNILFMDDHMMDVMFLVSLLGRGMPFESSLAIYALTFVSNTYLIKSNLVYLIFRVKLNCLYVLGFT